MAQSENTVTIYQNGIAAFERTYDVANEPKRFSLPFHKDHIGDVAATLSILGKVEVVEAPNYNPNKEDPALVIDPAKATNDLFTKLSGAEVAITLSGAQGETVKGRVSGYQTENNVLANGQSAPVHYLTIQKEDGSFQRLNFNTQVAGFTFTNAAVQSLIKKALDHNIEKINPDSVYLNTTLKASKPAKAVFKYAIPSPAFKLSYRLRQNGKGAWGLAGFGIVDNNTDEDWNNFNVTCATGQPVTFATDIAEIRIPTRSRINLVNESAVGAVEVESGMEAMGGGALECASFAPASAGGARAMKSRSRAAAAPMAACMNVADMEDATQAIAAAVEVGDSSFFKSSEPVTIPAKKSALVKIIDQQLKDAFFCLYYQPNKNTTRIMRALKLTNEATYTLGRGVCAIEQDGNHVGEAVLTLCKPGETSMLCYAAETGVKAMCEVGKEQSRCTKHNLAEGMLVSEWSKTRTTVYTFRNPKDEKFTCLFDHVPHLGTGATLSVDGADVNSKLSGGTLRYSVNVPVKGEKESVVTVTVTENLTTHTTVKAGEFLEWMTRNPESPLLKQNGLSPVITAYKDLQECNQEIKATQEKLQALRNEQTRIRQNVETLKGVNNHEAAQNLAKMTARLISADEEIVTIEQKTIPNLNTKQQSIVARIREFVTRCTAGWTAPAQPDDIKVLRSSQPV